ncbi:MAG: hypothetical protein QOJ51_5613 [Acidobacteriaceae bacterium]|nr:hypothetical protein [Acidobacteriaceae bacterium]
MNDTKCEARNVDKLLKLAADAHGGLNRWSQLRAIQARTSITGALWHVKVRPDAQDIHVRGELHQEQQTTYLIGEDKRFVSTPHQVALETAAGHLLENRDEPRSAFQGQQVHTPSDDLPVAYFNSYALWSYFTIPFVYTYPDFVTEAASILARERKGMAISQSDIPRLHRQPCARTGLVLWRGWIVA